MNKVQVTLTRSLIFSSWKPLPQISIRVARRTTSSIRHYNNSSFIGLITNSLQVSQKKFSSSSSNQIQSEGFKAGNMSTEPPSHEMVYLPDLLSATRSFGLFRKVLHTGLYSQLVAMEIPVHGEIGDEIHTVDQILLFTSGHGKAIVAGKTQDVKQGDVVIVPAGTQHQFLNVDDSQPLELITVYAPAEHHPTTQSKTKKEGDELEENGKDEPVEWSQRSKRENEELGLVKV